ncbi:MAG TPA: metallophosphoesterase [Vicinamibacterales bacterium]|nr:metallophosphoesterase [Vicinamibacterales bacterium]
MPSCFFVTDLHGRVGQYRALARLIEAERPAAVFLGGDLLPHMGSRAPAGTGGHFIEEFLQPLFLGVRERLAGAAPRVFAIFGNDDPRCAEPALAAGERSGAWIHAHNRRVSWEGFDVYGYAFVPPTPFLLKDWERYDVSRHVDPGAVSPEEGLRTVEVPAHEIRHATIQKDLDALTAGADLGRAIVLFHTPPYRTALDRAALDGRMIDHVPLEVHVGSIAVRRLIEERQPPVTLHGHIHESARLTGAWMEQLGRTTAISAAHDGPELALVRFDPDRAPQATRELVEL